MIEEIDKLNKFIKDHTEIIINKSEIAIPEEVRGEFYRRFDDVRRTVVERNYAGLPVDAAALCRNYVRIEREMIERLGLERIAVPVDLFSFLHDPKGGLTRAIYNRLFDLLQGKTSLEDFERLAEGDLREAAAELYRLGYEMWASLSFLILLDPDEAFFVDLDAEYKPVLAELKEIAFGRQAHHPTIRIPEFVLRSRRLDKYVAVKMALAREVETFVVPFTPPVRPKKKTGDTSFALDSRVMLLYFMAAPEEIPIVAEIYDRKLAAPDLMLEFVTAAEYSDPAALGEVKRHCYALRPRLGMCLFVIDPGEGMPAAEIEQGIQSIAAGFDTAKMEPILDRLT
jgi:hypothetical protein